MASLRYEVPGSDVGGEVGGDGNGAFSFTFATTGLSGSLTVGVSAVDWNGNPSTISLQLVDQGAIPTFHAEPGNHRVTLTWDDVPLSDGYSLAYTTNGTLPSTGYGIPIPNVTSPCTVTGLSNGAMHVFRLTSHSHRRWSRTTDR